MSPSHDVAFRCASRRSEEASFDRLGRLRAPVADRRCWLRAKVAPPDKARSLGGRSSQRDVGKDAMEAFLAGTLGFPSQYASLLPLAPRLAASGG